MRLAFAALFLGACMLAREGLWTSDSDEPSPGSGGATASAATVSATAASTGSSGGSGGSMAVPASCNEILEANASAADGDYLVDVDGEGPIAPFMVRCDMTTALGGWTRFHWLGEPFATGTDPLGTELHQCQVDDTSCLGRIPANANPTALLVKDVTDNHHAAWSFDGSEMAAAVLGALRDKVEVCLYQARPWQPFAGNATELYCGNEDDCRAFIYTAGGCGGFDDWTLELDDDGYWCQAAFKLGATYGDGTFSGDCGADDHGYLSDCDCDDELGELYYR